MTRNKREPRIGRRAAALAAAGALLVAACGDDGDDGDDSEAFCDQLESFNATWEGREHEEFDAMVAAMQDIDAPDEIDDEWPHFVKFAELMFAPAPDPEDEEAAQAHQERLTTEAQTIDEQGVSKVERYIEDNCAQA